MWRQGTDKTAKISSCRKYCPPKFLSAEILSDEVYNLYLWWRNDMYSNTCPVTVFDMFLINGYRFVKYRHLRILLCSIILYKHLSFCSCFFIDFVKYRHMFRMLGISLNDDWLRVMRMREYILLVTWLYGGKYKAGLGRNEKEG